MSGGARYVEADRSQPSWDMVDLEAWLPADHRARLVWGFAEGLDLGAFYEAIGSREGVAGRPAADPRVLLALWLYATLEGVGSARELDRLVREDLAYRWLAGGVSVNYHGLSDFRVGWAEELDRLLVESVTVLAADGLVTLEELTVDGTKVRASASSGSFTRGGRLERIERQAGERIERLKQELSGDPAASSKRRQAAQRRAAREAQAKVDKARATLERLREEKKRREKSHPMEEKAKGAPSVSLSDPQARRMRFADGSVRAGYNLQTVAIADKGLVVTVLATDRRNDQGLARPMVDEVSRRYGVTPRRLLIDEGYASRADVEGLAQHPDGPVSVYMPPAGEKPDETLTPIALARRLAKRAKEPAAVQDWRARMRTEDAAAVFRRRKLIERIHAHYKNRGLGQLTLRGLAKVQAAALWHALANNLMVAHRLRAQAA
ncbi:MAG: IS1182 family transposase [Caulobacteraceae bacterium]|nr:IS1182 family transposase [Caulobacteraceae bacterium]